MKSDLRLPIWPPADDIHPPWAFASADDDGDDGGGDDGGKSADGADDGGAGKSADGADGGPGKSADGSDGGPGKSADGADGGPGATDSADTADSKGDGGSGSTDVGGGTTGDVGVGGGVGNTASGPDSGAPGSDTSGIGGAGVGSDVASAIGAAGGSPAGDVGGTQSPSDILGGGISSPVSQAIGNAGDVFSPGPGFDPMGGQLPVSTDQSGFPGLSPAAPDQGVPSAPGMNIPGQTAGSQLAANAFAPGEEIMPVTAGQPPNPADTPQLSGGVLGTPTGVQTQQIGPGNSMAPGPAGLTAGPFDPNAATNPGMPAWTGMTNLPDANVVPSALDVAPPGIMAGMPAGFFDSSQPATPAAATAPGFGAGVTAALTPGPAGQDTTTAVQQAAQAAGAYYGPATFVTPGAVATSPGGGVSPSVASAIASAAPDNTFTAAGPLQGGTTATAADMTAPSVAPSNSPGPGPGPSPGPGPGDQAPPSDITGPTAPVANSGTSDGGADGGVGSAASLTQPIPPPSGAGGAGPRPIPVLAEGGDSEGNFNPDAGLFGYGTTLPITLGFSQSAAADGGADGGGGNFGTPDQGMFAAIANAVDTTPPLGNINPDQGID